MRKQTNMQEVKALARSFLMFDPEPTELSPLVVKHPFTDSGIVGIRTPDGEYAIGNIMENPEDLHTWRKQVSRQIDSADSVMQIAYMLTNSYSIGFLKYVHPYLDKTDFSQLLGYLWVCTEAPNSDPNLSKMQMLNLFRKADPAVLMDETELQQFRQLEDLVTVYRGVTSHNADNVKALSWTLDRDKAAWFAHRFGEDGTVYEAQIPKQHIWAFLNSRGESEVIVDPRELQDITESQDEGMALTQNLL